MRHSVNKSAEWNCTNICFFRTAYYQRLHIIGDFSFPPSAVTRGLCATSQRIMFHLPEDGNVFSPKVEFGFPTECNSGMSLQPTLPLLLNQSIDSFLRLAENIKCIIKKSNVGSRQSILCFFLNCVTGNFTSICKVLKWHCKRTK